MGIILASRSPRRKELLRKIVDEFKVVPSDIDESSINETDPVSFAIEASILKAKDVARKYPDEIVIGADTVVAVGNYIIGKPLDKEDAKRILKLLSGTKHRVITGIAIYRESDRKLITNYEVSYVKFKDLSDEEIEKELSKNDYMDKAGAYAIQSVGDTFVEELKGDYDNVVGLPVNKLKKLLKIFNTPDFEVDIVDMAFPKNWAVGRKSGMVVFVPDGVYGDRVKVYITERKKNFAYGKISEVVRYSPYRIEPLCKHFGICGGCVLQNLIYDKQIELKSRYMLNTIKKIAGNTVFNDESSFSFFPSPDIFFYRNKMEFAFGNREGEVVLGLRQRTSPLSIYKKETVPLSECPIFSNVVKEIFPPFLEFVEDTGLGVYDLYTREGFFRHLLVREGKNTGEVMVALITKSGEIPDMTRLMELIPESVKSLWWVENNRISDVVYFERKHNLYGSSFITEKMGNMKFKITPQAFFQPNTNAAELLYQKIKEEIENSGVKNILGLYCGSGVMEIFLSSAVKKVIGVDIEPVNISTAEENCKINNVKNCEFYQCAVEDLLKKYSQEIKNIDAVIVDPPRQGLSKKAMKNIISIGSRMVIYVSCSVSAFARDITGLIEAGYKMNRLYGFDFFPHTAHLETLGIFIKE